VLERLIEELAVNLLPHDNIDTVLPKYMFLTRKKPLTIKNIVNITKSIGNNGGMIGIYCSSKIIIDKNGEINNIDSKHGDDDNKDEENENGGFIVLSSLEGIIINGVISGKRIVLLSGNEIINNGEIISCDSTFICCKSFKNNNNKIKQKPITTNWNKFDHHKNNKYLPTNLPWKTNTDKNREKKIKLTITDYRGYYRGYDRYYPRHLIDGKDDTYYISKEGDPSEDWIIFGISNPPIHPTKISIRNDDYGNWGISSISLFIGSSVSDAWYPLCSDIKRIHNKNRKEQYFDIDESLLIKDYKIFYLKLDRIKLKILKNHGSSLNCFYSFSLFGIEYG